MHDLFVHGYGIQQRYFACLSSLEKHAISHADEVAALAKVGPYQFVDTVLNHEFVELIIDVTVSNGPGSTSLLRRIS